MTIFAQVLATREGAVGFLTLNRPKALHSLNPNMVGIVTDSLRAWALDPAVQCVVFKSAPRGGKAFCAGGDVRSLYDEGIAPDSKAGHGVAGMLTADFFRYEYIMNHLCHTLPKPSVALWDGIVMGGGVGLTAHGRFRVATERTLFAMPETAIGLFPDVGMTWSLPRLPAGDGGDPELGFAVGMYLGLTGARLTASADMVFSGLATHAVHSSLLEGLEEALKAGPPDVGAVLSGAAAASAPLFAELEKSDPKKAAPTLAARADAIKRCFGAHQQSVEAVVAALEAEQSDDEKAWAARCLKQIGGASPSSLKVSHRLLHQNGKDVPLSEALATEYVVAQRCMRPGKDFFEGIRAVLVDKNDPPPRWSPKTLAEVSAAEVDSFFAPLEPQHMLAIK